MRPKLQSTPPSTRARPETCLPRFRSNEGDQGTSWKPSPSSIMAKRPDDEHETLTIGAGDVVSARGLLEGCSRLGGELLAGGVEFALAQRVEEVAGVDDLLRPAAARAPARSGDRRAPSSRLAPRRRIRRHPMMRARGQRAGDRSRWRRTPSPACRCRDRSAPRAQHGAGHARRRTGATRRSIRPRCRRPHRDREA